MEMKVITGKQTNNSIRNINARKKKQKKNTKWSDQQEQNEKKKTVFE